MLNAEFGRLFPEDMEILAEPGRFLVGHRRHPGGQGRRQGRARRQAVLLHQRRRVPHVLGIIFDHIQYHLKAFKRRADADLLGLWADLRRLGHDLAWPKSCRDLDLGDLVYSENIGAYSHASSTYFNGFPPAKVVHVNQ